MQLIEVSDREAWDGFVTANAAGHPLQLWGWGEVKRLNGWRPVRLALVESGHDASGPVKWRGAVQVLLWRVPKIGRFVAYAPRGPVMAADANELSAMWRALEAWARQNRALYLRVEPGWAVAARADSQIGTKRPAGWVQSRNTIQMSATYTIDLMRGEDEILADMSRKHRQYIGKAEREGVVVERVAVGGAGDSVAGGAMAAAMADVLRIYQDTARRAGFGLHSREYYESVLRELGERNYLYIARVGGEATAFLWLAAAGETATELYGGVTAAGQDSHANYLLKWRAITDLKAAGYKLYDFNGRVSEGVSRFKSGFGPAETDFVGTWDYPVNKILYRAWESFWPVIKRLGRTVKGAKGGQHG